MKEGYLQLKIAELNDKLKQIDQMMSMEKSKIELLEQRTGGLKELIKKLKDLDEFKDNLLKEIQKENKILIEEESKIISNKISKEIDNLLKSKTREIEDILNYMKSRENEINKQTEMISDINEKITYLMKHNEYLMMKLVNKAVLNDREVNEMHMRSSKKSK